MSFGENGHKKHCSVCNEEYGDYLSHDIDTLNWKDNSTHHWHECGDCGYKIDYKEHTYEKYGTDEICSICKHLEAEKEDTTDGGFDIKPKNTEPEGTLTVEKANENFIATFSLDEDSSMTDIFWLLDDVELEGEHGLSCRFTAPDRRTYRIMCVVFNKSLVNSYDQTVIGGVSL